MREPTQVPPPELEPKVETTGQSGRKLAAVAGIIVAITAVLIALLVTGGGSTTNSESPGDLRRVEGKEPRRSAGPPISASAADILDAAVHSQDSRIVFTITTASQIPVELERSSLEFRFDLSGENGGAWIVTGSVNVEATAAVVSQSSGYTSSTIDGSIPGAVEVSGDELQITLEPGEIEGFPESFEWRLSSTLIAFRDVARSTRVEDNYPDEGAVSFER